MSETVDDTQKVKPKTSRSSRWSTSGEALQHIAKAFSNTKLKVRTADKVTLGLLLASTVMAVVVVLFPQFAYTTALLCDIFFALTIIFFITQRLGIVTTFNDKQTVFATELMFGFLIAGIFIVINLTVFVMQNFR
ncbi:MAG: hypothetical protein U0103_27960 [Candidatus Obscuribacterales bacterium]|nr:hypothetical protein [Cyanobacteria bacterium SZAS LIN-5]RTL37735.1 MAG: hypothetical protein EKK48_23920 [Candidatus Melainabacteria bacterium]